MVYVAVAAHQLLSVHVVAGAVDGKHRIRVVGLVKVYFLRITARHLSLCRPPSLAILAAILGHGHLDGGWLRRLMMIRLVVQNTRIGHSDAFVGRQVVVGSVDSF